MLNRMQLEDSKKCEQLQEEGKDMDCLGCSCNICKAEEPSYYKKGLRKSIEIIEKEIEFAREVSHHMVAGMLQIKYLLEKELVN